jgi:hypothetical protein
MKFLEKITRWFKINVLGYSEPKVILKEIDHSSFVPQSPNDGDVWLPLGIRQPTGSIKVEGGEHSIARVEPCAREYVEALNRASTSTSGSDCDGSWNRDFLKLLDDNGLKLSKHLPESNAYLYPNGVPYMAPASYGDTDGWYGMYVVWKDELTTLLAMATRKEPLSVKVGL